MNLFCTLLSIGCTAGTLSGSAYVHDGDTLSISNQPIRLAGIDAEELSEPHGIAARDHLRELVASRTVTCTWQGWSYDRKVGTCGDLNARMVADGYALDCAYYSGGKYRLLEPVGIRSKLIQKPYC